MCGCISNQERYAGQDRGVCSLGAGRMDEGWIVGLT